MGRQQETERTIALNVDEFMVLTAGKHKLADGTVMLGEAQYTFGEACEIVDAIRERFSSAPANSIQGLMRVRNRFVDAFGHQMDAYLTHQQLSLHGKRSVAA